MKIAFFGDSFCATYGTDLVSGPQHETYIKKLKLHYNAEIVHLGISGSSIWDAMLLQFAQFSSNLPDVCVFCWTDYARIFNRTVRSINYGSVLRNLSGATNTNIWKAAHGYYEHLHDEEKDQFQYVSGLYYFDNEILSTVKNNTKIIHLWSYGNFNYELFDPFESDKINYSYRWKSGLEIRPSLINVSMANIKDKTKLSNDTRPNHLDGQEKNTLVFNWIKNAIDNYNDGDLLNLDNDILNLKRTV